MFLQNVGIYLQVQIVLQPIRSTLTHSLPCEPHISYGVNKVWQTKMHTVEPLVPQHSSEVKVTIENLKRYKSPSVEQIPVGLIQEGGETLCSVLLILFKIRKNCKWCGRNLLLYILTQRAMKHTVVIIKEYHCYQLHTKLYPTSFSQD
jgi:hypothetical protein